MLKGWRGALVASLATALLIFAVNGPSQRGYSVGGEDHTGKLLAFLFSANMLLAYFTAALVIVGLFTYFTFNRQADIMSAQIKLARDEFNAAHRPRIVVRSTNMLPGSVTDDGKEGPAICDFMAANTGESPARIVSFIAIGYIQAAEHAFVPQLVQKGERRRPDNLVIAPGAAILIRAHSPNIDFDYENWKHAGGTMFVVGEVEYSGPDDIRRTMGFCREYRPSEGMWYPHINPAYEYN